MLVPFNNINYKLMFKILIAAILLLTAFDAVSQVRRLTIVDAENKEPINNVRLLSENGNILNTSDSKGIIFLKLKSPQEKNATMVETSHFLYTRYKENLEQIPDTIKLIPKANLLEEVIVTKKKNGTRYYKLIAYFRTWRMVNNKLQNYVEGTKEVHVPYDHSNSNKEYFTQYVSYKDSLYHKNYIDISFGGDGFLYTKIYPNDYFTRHKKLYNLVQSSENYYDLMEGGAKVGYVKYDDTHQISEVNKKDIAEDVKLLGHTINYRDYSYERWNNSGNRHLSMSRNTIKKEIKGANSTHAIETVTEIYIEDEEFERLEKPTKYKNAVNPDRSFYEKAFYKNYRVKYPLQKEIEIQLNTIQQNENTY